MRAIDIEWEGPFEIPYVRDKDLYQAPVFPKELEQGAQIYALYGRHPVHGPGSLLYIGKTDRSITQRLGEHLLGHFWFQKELFVHAGIISESNKTVEDTDVIGAVESLLIAAHLPALNTAYLRGPNPSAQGLHVVNWGVPGSVMPECSSRYFTQFEEY